MAKMCEIDLSQWGEDCKASPPESSHGRKRFSEGSEGENRTGMVTGGRAGVRTTLPKTWRMAGPSISTTCVQVEDILSGPLMMSGKGPVYNLTTDLHT